MTVDSAGDPWQQILEELRAIREELAAIRTVTVVQTINYPTPETASEYYTRIGS